MDSKHKNRKIFFIVNIDWFFLSHRLPLALAALKQGFEVHIACRFTEKREYIESLGIITHELQIQRGNSSLLNELKSFFDLIRLFRRFRPDIVHLVTIKPVLYGSIAARICNTPAVVAAVSGLGTVFIASNTREKITQAIVRLLYRIAFSTKRIKVIFQNQNDASTVIRMTKLAPSQYTIIKGSGVDIRRHQYSPEKCEVAVVAFIGRLIRDKGIIEFIDAIRLLQLKGVHARFEIIGDIDPDNPTSLLPAEIEEMKNMKDVLFVGLTEDIPSRLETISLVVLPSYREGMPKVLLEAAASGRAVVTTDVPGCRDAIIPGETGLLVPVRDSCALAEAMEILINDRDMRTRFGEKARKLAKEEFDINLVVSRHMEIYEEITKLPPLPPKKQSVRKESPN